MAEYIYSQHTSACQENHRHLVTVLATMDQYRRNHPKHCKTCGGSGILWEEGDSSVGLWGYWYPCDACVQRGICPRCGELHGCAIDEETDIEHESHACVECGFIIGHGESLDQLRAVIEGLPDCICPDADPWL